MFPSITKEADLVFDVRFLKNPFYKIFVKTQRNSTQLNPTLKQLALELDIVVKCTHICCGTSPYMLWNLQHKLYFYYKEWS